MSRRTGKFSGLGAIEAALMNLPRDAAEAVSKALDVVLPAAVDRARGRIHSVSGDLAKSVRTSRTADGLAGKLRAGGPKAAHAHLVEFGHRTKQGGHVPAHPFLTPTVEEARDDFQEEVIKRLRARAAQ